MAFETKCPDCSHFFNSPDRLIGAMGICPRCGHGFRMLPCKESKSNAESYGVKDSSPPPAAEVRPKKEAIEEMKTTSKGGPYNSFDVADLKRGRGVSFDQDPPKPAYTSKKQIFSGDGGAFDNVYGFIAVVLASVGLLCANFPVVEYLAIPLLLSGLLLGIGSAFLPGSAVQRFTMPGIVLLIAFPTLLIVLKAPEWFREKRAKPEEASPKDKYLWVKPGERPLLPEKQEDKINASQFAVQRNDIRVAVAEVRYKRAEYTQNKQKLFTKEPKVHILLRVLNSGYEKPFDFAGWRTYGEGAKLFDPEGQELGEWSPPKGALQKVTPTTTLFPGKTCEEWVIFDAPKVKFESLVLDLPGKAFGAEEGKITMFLPSSLITK